MEILGTNFTLTLGGWRLRLVLSIEETEAVSPQGRTASHHLAVIKESNEARGAQR